MRRKFLIAVLAVTAMSLGAVSGAAASALIRADRLQFSAAEAVLVHHKPGHKMKHWNRGRHYGWTRGKHKGWYKHGRR